MQVEPATADTPFCPLTAMPDTLPPNKLPDGDAEVSLLLSTLRQEELRLGIRLTAQQCSHVDRRGHYQSRTCRYYELVYVSNSLYIEHNTNCLVLTTTVAV